MKHVSLAVTSAGLAMLAAVCMLNPARPSAEAPPLPFEAVQTDLFAVPNSYSNAWADFDNDGRLDLAVSIGSGEVRLYRNDNGTLVNVGREMGLPQAGGGSYELRGLSWGDYDGDGFVDLLGGATAADHLTKIFHNLAGKRFVDVAADLGLTIPGRSARQTSWVDYDNDRFRNDGHAFVDLAPKLSMTGPPRTKDEGGVGCAVGDYDNDGRLDLFVANYGRNQLYHNNGDGTFTDVAKQLGVDVENHAVSADWGDYDNDGYLDLMVISYQGPVDHQQPANALFHNEGGKRFVNVMTGGSPLNVADHGVQWVDYDNDGGLDLSVTRGYTTQGGHFLFRSTRPDSVKRRSLEVTVLDAKGRATRFGAEVRLFDASGRIFGTRQVSTGGGDNSQSVVPLHFGLAKPERLTVEATFMTRHGRKTQTIKNVNPADFYGKTLVIRERPS